VVFNSLLRVLYRLPLILNYASSNLAAQLLLLAKRRRVLSNLVFNLLEALDDVLDASETGFDFVLRISGHGSDVHQEFQEAFIAECLNDDCHKLRRIVAQEMFPISGIRQTKEPGGYDLTLCRLQEPLSRR